MSGLQCSIVLDSTHIQSRGNHPDATRAKLWKRTGHSDVLFTKTWNILSGETVWNTWARLVLSSDHVGVMEDWSGWCWQRQREALYSENEIEKYSSDKIEQRGL